MAKRKKARSFSRDVVEGEFEKPGPKIDPEAGAISEALSKLSNRERTPFVLSWLPSWAKKAEAQPFSFYFFEDRLAVDSFGRDQEEIDALADGLTDAQQKDIAKKTALCKDHGVNYLPMGPDEELDLMTLAAKIGKAEFKKGKTQTAARQTAGVVSRASDGIEEEESL